jgi:tungstate transport system permease protein
MQDAFMMMVSGDAEAWGIIGRSLTFSVLAVFLSAIPGIPAGIAIGWKPTKARRLLASAFHALSAVPTVVIGLVVYGFISRSGALGFLNLLYTPAGVVLGQYFLALPLIISFIIAGFSKIDPRFRDTIETHGLRPGAVFMLAMQEGRSVIASAIAMAFSRVIGEVGVAMMLGGNIRGLTRTMTTAIALDAAKGEFGRAVSLGIVLLLIALAVNLFITSRSDGEGSVA